MGDYINKEFVRFESENNLIIPDDLKQYFCTFKADDYDMDMFAFYDFSQFKSVKDEVGDYGGIPDYRNIINTLPAHANCFVFMEYFIHLSVYAIHLNNYHSGINEVYAICGDSFKVVANSFKEFLEIYFSEEWDGIFI